MRHSFCSYSHSTFERKGTEFSWLVVYYEKNWLLTELRKVWMKLNRQTHDVLPAVFSTNKQFLVWPNLGKVDTVVLGQSNWLWSLVIKARWKTPRLMWPRGGNCISNANCRAVSIADPRTSIIILIWSLWGSNSNPKLFVFNIRTMIHVKIIKLKVTATIILPFDSQT